MRFVKMEALGNDFVVIDGPVEIDTNRIVEWCDRRRGIGADGVIVVEPLEAGAVKMDYWNADGSPSEMCGNGMRCVARHALESGWVSGRDLVIEGGSGRRRAVLEDGAVTVELGRVEVGQPLVVAGVEVIPARIGNPHAVAFIDDPATAPVSEAGPEIETDPSFPEGTNVEFVSVVNRDQIEMRVWERGVGETLACGSGAAAAAAVSRRLDRVGDRVTVSLPGGSLGIELRGDVAWLTGPATFVYRGEIAGS